MDILFRRIYTYLIDYQIINETGTALDKMISRSNSKNKDMKYLQSIKVARYNKLTLLLLGILIAVAAMTTSVHASPAMQMKTDSVEVADDELNKMLRNILNDMSAADFMFYDAHLIRVYNMSDSLIFEKYASELSLEERQILRRSDHITTFNKTELYLFGQ